MSVLRLLVAGVAVCSLTLGVRAEEKAEAKDIAKLLLGSWEAVKAAPDTLPVGAVVEFGKGKVKVTHKGPDGKDVTMDGTCTLDGDKLTCVFKKDGKEDKHTITIKKISDKELIAVGPDGKVVEFKRTK